MENHDKPPMRLEFAPGCFDSFEGTQQELDQLIVEITRLAESGEFWEQAVILDDEDMPADFGDDLPEMLADVPAGRLLN
jgi:hypothetical protein